MSGENLDKRSLPEATHGVLRIAVVPVVAASGVVVAIVVVVSRLDNGHTTFQMQQGFKIANNIGDRVHGSGNGFIAASASTAFDACAAAYSFAAGVCSLLLLPVDDDADDAVGGSTGVSCFDSGVGRTGAGGGDGV